MNHINETQNSFQQPVIPQQQHQVSYMPHPSPSLYSPPPRKKNKGCLIAVIVSVLFLCVGCSVIFVGGGLLTFIGMGAAIESVTDAEITVEETPIDSVYNKPVQDVILDVHPGFVLETNYAGEIIPNTETSGDNIRLFLPIISSSEIPGLRIQAPLVNKPLNATEGPNVHFQIGSDFLDGSIKNNEGEWLYNTGISLENKDLLTVFNEDNPGVVLISVNHVPESPDQKAIFYTPYPIYGTKEEMMGRLGLLFGDRTAGGSRETNRQRSSISDLMTIKYHKIEGKWEPVGSPVSVF